MIKIQYLSDKLAIFLSSVCFVHCLILPLLLIVIPPLAGSVWLDDESFHMALLYLVVPLGLFALTLGFRHHKSWSLLGVGLFGLTVLALIALFGHDVLGETWEVILTMATSVLIAFVHYRNYQLRKTHACALDHGADKNCKTLHKHQSVAGDK